MFWHQHVERGHAQSVYAQQARLRKRPRAKKAQTTGFMHLEFKSGTYQAERGPSQGTQRTHFGASQVRLASVTRRSSPFPYVGLDKERWLVPKAIGSIYPNGKVLR